MPEAVNPPTVKTEMSKSFRMFDFHVFLCINHTECLTLQTLIVSALSKRKNCNVIKSIALLDRLISTDTSRIFSLIMQNASSFSVCLACPWHHTVREQCRPLKNVKL